VSIEIRGGGRLDYDPQAPPTDQLLPEFGSEVLFLNARRARSHHLGRYEIPEAYRLASQFFHCGVMDRTGTLDQGFPYQTLDTIPTPKANGPDFNELCDQTGEALVAKAEELDTQIRVLWSGGIDSTSAIISLMKAADAAGRPGLLEVVCSDRSIEEYPWFFAGKIQNKYRVTKLDGPVPKTLDPGYVNVTGEHGDQLFGSMLLESHVKSGLAQRPYQDALPQVLEQSLGSEQEAEQVMGYLAGQFGAAPLELTSLFDALWWINYSMKWQHVTLRLPAFSSSAHEVHESLEHFFRGDGFQNWTLTNGSLREIEDWTRYKEPAKQYILDFTGDGEYFRTKTKEGSLQHVMRDASAPNGYLIHMTKSFRPVFIAAGDRSAHPGEFE
jgi:hypothetical protein